MKAAYSGLRTVLVLVFLFGVSLHESRGQYIVHFTVSQPDKLEAFGGGNHTVPMGTQVQLGGNPAALGGTPPYTYLWNPSWGLDNPALPNPTLTADSALAYTLTVTDNVQCTASESVQVNLIIGMDQQSGHERVFSIFPNPVAGGVLYIRNEKPGPGPFEVTIRNMPGQVISRFSAYGEVFAVSLQDAGMQKGVYFLTITSGNDHHFKIIVP